MLRSQIVAKTFNILKSQNRKALIPFITAGDPNPQVTVPLMHQLVHSGANIIELGVPFRSMAMGQRFRDRRNVL